jgi:hypothetical protein
MALAGVLVLGIGSARAETPLDTEMQAVAAEPALRDEAGNAGEDTSASEESDTATDPGSIPEGEAPAPAAAPEPRGTVDVVHGALSTGILATAEWLDSFFDDPRFAAEENRTRVKLGVDYFVERGTAPDFSIPVSARLVLPKLQNKARIVVVGTPDRDLEGQTTTGTAAGRLPGAQDENLTAALDYFFLTTDRHNFATRVGARFREGEPEVFVQPRYRYLLPLDPWALRFTQEFKWWTEFGWEETTTVDLERPFGENLFFRTTAQGAWTEQVNGYFYSLSFSLRQPLSPRRVLQYELTNSFQTRPTDQLEEIRAVVRYRQKIWRDWMFYEIAPHASYRRERDFDFTPGILFRFEMIFGRYEGTGV